MKLSKRFRKTYIFLKGFDYGLKNFGNNNDATFYTWNSNKEDNQLYRKAIFIGKTYGFYRFEIITFSLIFTGFILLLTM
jgi:hypothetical protein